jgi:hypothetical protein
LARLDKTDMALDMAKRDFKYRKLVIGEAERWKSMTIPQADCLRPIADTFKTNLDRTATFAFAPAQISYLVRVDQRLLACSVFKVTGKIEPVFPLVVEPGQRDKIQAEMESQRASFHSSPREKFEELRKDGISYIERLLNNSQGMQLTMEAIFSSLIVSYWATFESLAPDLWKASVNHGPAMFAQRVILASMDKADEKITKHWKDKLQCDPRQDYAGSLIEAGRVSFRSLDKIIQWYSVIFEGAARRIFKDNRDIYALAAYRNALSHNSGKVDKDFIKQVEPVPDLRGKFNENQELLIDGEFVRRLQDAVAIVGEQLIQLVDSHLAPQSP